MTKRRGQRRRRKSEEQPEAGAAFDWIPLWGWVLIFLLPLIASELMFWNVGRTFSMIVFPIAWVGFWVAMMQRSGWSILRSRRGEKEPNSEKER